MIRNKIFTGGYVMFYLDVHFTLFSFTMKQQKPKTTM